MLTKLRSKISNTATNVARKLKKIGFTPNTLTFLGLLFSIISGYLYYKGEFILGGLILLLIGICDILDGALAREMNAASAIGGVLDSTVDRYSDLLIFFGYWQIDHEGSTNLGFTRA